MVDSAMYATISLFEGNYKEALQHFRAVTQVSLVHRNGGMSCIIIMHHVAVIYYVKCVVTNNLLVI